MTRGVHRANSLHPASWSSPAITGILALGAAIPYLNTLANGFVYDDLMQVLNNPYILNFHHLRAIFTTGAWSYFGTQGTTNYYRPLMTLSYLACYHVFADLAFGYHLVNVALHVGVVCVLFGFTLSLFRRRDVAFLAALIFAFHPVHTNSVAWIADITDVEMTLFFLLAFWCFVKLARPEGGRSEWAFLGMVVCFALALLSKENALVLPLLAVVYEHAGREDRARTTWPQKLARYGVLWLLSGAYLLLRIRALGAFAPITYPSRVSWPQTLLSAVALVGEYLGKLLWPATLCAFYVFHKSTSLLDPRVIAGLAALAAVAAACILLWKRSRPAAFGFIWFFATLAPVLNARWMAFNVFAERYLYLPSVGFCWVLAWVCVEVWREAGTRWKVARPAMAGCLAILLALAAGRIFLRNRDWRDSLRLYTRTMAQQPDAYPILNDLGTVYWQRGEVQAARRAWMEVLEAQPHFALALNNLGLMYARERNYPQAVAYFQEAMRLKPLYTDAHINLGRTYPKLGEWKRAELQLTCAVALSPLDTEARNSLGALYLDEGNDVRAEEQFQASVRSEPNLTAFNRLGEIYMRRAQPARAERVFRRALSLNTYDSEARFALGGLYSSAGRNQEAIREYRAGLESDPRNAQALAALGRLERNDAPSK
jgi:protein O-mannosyl-transferase